MKDLLKYVSIIFLLTHSYTQAQKLNDIKKHIAHSKEDTNRVKAYVEWLEYWQPINTDSMYKYLGATKELSQKLNYSWGILAYHKYLINYYWSKGNNQKVMEEAQITLAMARKFGDEQAVIRAMINIGLSQSTTNHLSEALSSFFEVIKLIEDKGKQADYPDVYGGIALVLKKSGELSKSHSYFQKYLDYSSKNPESYIYSEACFNLATSFENYKNQNDSAIVYYQKGYEVALKIGDNLVMAANLCGLGRVYSKQKKLKQAWKAIREADAIAHSINHAYINIFLNMAYVQYYLASNNAGRAAEFGEKLTNAMVKANLEEDFFENYKEVAEAQRQNGNLAKALEYQTKYYQIKENVTNRQVKIQLQSLEKNYQTALREKHILALEKTNQRRASIIYGLIGALILIAIIGFLFFLNTQNRKKMIESELTKLKKERQLLATTSILKGQDNERARIAKDLHDGLGGLLSGLKLALNNFGDKLNLSVDSNNTFKRIIEQLDNVINEMRRIAYNMMPESLIRFGLIEALKDYCENINSTNQINIHFQDFGFNKRIDPSYETIVYRIVQELLNNVIKHAEAADISIQLTKLESQLSISIEDNGKGFVYDKDNKSKSSSGIRNVQARVDYLAGTIDIKSSPTSGTSIFIEIPIQKL